MFGTKKVLNEKLYKSAILEKNGEFKDWSTWSFMEFIEHLLPPSSDLDGCEMICKFPESVFFEKGKPNFISMTDKNDGKLKE